MTQREQGSVGKATCSELVVQFDLRRVSVLVTVPTPFAHGIISGADDSAAILETPGEDERTANN